MNYNPLHYRSLWSLDTLSSGDLSALIDTALTLKQAAGAGRPPQPLRGKNIAVMCEASDDPALHDFTAAASALGARVAHIRPSNSRITQPSDTQETASVLGRLYDAIECEGMPLAVVKDVERGAGRPVFNGLAEASHPLRVIGDLMTMREHAGKPLKELTMCYVGDASSPTGDAWLQSAALTGLGLCIASDPAQRPQQARLERARKLAGDTGARLHLCEPIDVPADAVDFIWDEKENGRCSDGRVELACTCNDEEDECVPSLGGAQVANHLYALQALLCSTVA
jgi:ornithine carbamoyltransferase